MNLAGALAATAQRSPDRRAIVSGESTLTYGELEDHAARLGASLNDLGVEPGDRLALWLGNRPSFVVALYAAWRAGAVVVPINPMLTHREARYILDDADAGVLVCGAQQYESRPSVRTVIVDGDARGGDLALDTLLASAPAAIVELADDNLALLGYTSGTTGLPKGAMLTHGNLSANVQQMLSSPLAPSAADVALGILPLAHIFGLNVVLHMFVTVGGAVVLHERFDPARTLRSIREQRITRIAAAPAAYVAWLNLSEASRDDFATVTAATSGAAPLSADVHRRFAERFGLSIWEGYGLTETSPTVTSTAVGGVPKPGSVGRPFPGVALRLLDESGFDVEPGDPGEIVVRGPNVFRGYWQHPDETSHVLRDGWFRTGDIAVTDDDGDLYLVDRKKDLIIVSGFNVYPKEVEDVLLAHPHVRDAAVVGAPDELHGERVRALVVADAEPDELREWCREHLAAFKVPTDVSVVDEIPRNAAGKVLRRELR